MDLHATGPADRGPARRGDGAFAWDEFRTLGLEAACDDAGLRQVEAYWEEYLPLALAVDGTYEFLTVGRTTRAVVHSAEPEFEGVSVVAADLPALLARTGAGPRRPARWPHW